MKSMMEWIWSCITNEVNLASDSALEWHVIPYKCSAGSVSLELKSGYSLHHYIVLGRFIKFMFCENGLSFNGIWMSSVKLKVLVLTILSDISKGFCGKARIPGIVVSLLDAPFALIFHTFCSTQHQVNLCSAGKWEASWVWQMKMVYIFSLTLVEIDNGTRKLLRAD